MIWEQSDKEVARVGLPEGSSACGALYSLWGKTLQGTRPGEDSGAVQEGGPRVGVECREQRSKARSRGLGGQYAPVSAQRTEPLGRVT